MDNDPVADQPDGLTIIRAPGRRLAKIIRADGTMEGYDRTRHFDLFAVQVPDQSALVLLLNRLGDMTDCAVVRGAISDAARTRRVRRLLHPDQEGGYAATLREVRRAWVALDFDSIPLPAGCDWRDLRQCGDVARAMLPRTFHDAALVVVATASHGFKPGARVRGWALLDTPLSGAELTAWLRGTPCDASKFRTVQPIYAAAPVFEGMADPLPRRLVVLPGRERVACPSPSSLAPRPRKVTGAPPKEGEAGAGGYAFTALARATTAVAMASENSRHETAVRQAWSLAKLVAAGLLTADAVGRAMDGALQLAGKLEGEGAAIAAWALSQHGIGEGVQR
jgi:hypothetical protein